MNGPFNIFKLIDSSNMLIFTPTIHLKNNKKKIAINLVYYLKNIDHKAMSEKLANGNLISALGSF